jgi:hypothetical protein
VFFHYCARLHLCLAPPSELIRDHEVRYAFAARASLHARVATGHYKQGAWIGMSCPHSFADVRGQDAGEALLSLMRLQVPHCLVFVSPAQVAPDGDGMAGHHNQSAKRGALGLIVQHTGSRPAAATAAQANSCMRLASLQPEQQAEDEGRCGKHKQAGSAGAYDAWRSAVAGHAAS